MWKKWNGRQVKESFRSICASAMIDAVEATGAKADQEVPHDEGTLMRSKHVMQDIQFNTIITSIGYGGGGNSGHPVVPYARKWHEIPANFKKGRKSQYLRDPVKTVMFPGVKQKLTDVGLK